MNSGNQPVIVTDIVENPEMPDQIRIQIVLFSLDDILLSELFIKHFGKCF